MPTDAEQHAHITAHAELTHALDQVDRQQRVPAQFEEVIVTPDLFDLQHLGPDLRQEDFDITLRGFIFAADQRLRSRCRQRLAIQLAVGRQGQHRQAHVGRRQHRTRQTGLQMGMQLRDVQRLAFGEPGQ